MTEGRGTYVKALRDLVRLSFPVDEALLRLSKAARDPQDLPVDISADDIANALHRYRLHQVDDSSLERWAEAVHSLEDIRYADPHRDYIAQALFELSTPELHGSMPEVVGRVEGMLAKARGTD